MRGIGTGPFGVMPYGLGTASQAPVPGGRMFDDGTGVQTGSRKIDERTRQYAFNAYGRVVGMSDVRQLVLMALTTVAGSSSMPSLGHNLSSIKDIGADFDRHVETTLRAAVKSLVDQKLIEVREITIQKFQTPGTSQDKGAKIMFRWRDLTDPKRREHSERVL